MSKSEDPVLRNLQYFRQILNTAHTNHDSERFLRLFIAGVAQNPDIPVSMLVEIGEKMLETRVNEIIDYTESLRVTPDPDRPPEGERP